MPKPDWNQKQNPGQKSKDHGKHDNGHGPDEHGMGAVRDPDHEHGPKQDPDDLTIIEPDEGEPETALGGDGEPIVGATVYPASYYVPNAPPHTNQGTTPQCVAHSNAYDQNQQDRPEQGAFLNFDKPRFFSSIGGTSQGASMSAGLVRRRDYGYPTVVAGSTGSLHRIAGYTQIPLTVTAIKDAILKGHGVLFIGDWFHSWNHPLSSGKLPAPDYKIGGHAIWIRGWNDSYGFKLRNSWGSLWGPIGGDAFMPYAFLSRMYAAYRTTDK